MLALALLLLFIVAVLVVVSFVGSSDEVVIEFLNVTVTTSVGEVFVTGFVAGLVTLAALVAIWTSVRRIRKRREEVRELRRRAERTAPATADIGSSENRYDEAVVRGEDASQIGPPSENEAITEGQDDTSRRSDQTYSESETSGRGYADPESPTRSEPPRS